MRFYLGIALFVVTVSVYSCRKTKLDDEKSILAGEWQWIYTEEYVQPNAFMPSNLESVIYADSFPKSFALNFMICPPFGTSISWLIWKLVFDISLYEKVF